MPRERINYPTEGTVIRGGPLPAPSIVHVSWMPAHRGEFNGHVQVALEVDVEYAKIALAEPNGDKSATTLLYSHTLDREDINRMIRVLRNARDRAYGRDA